MEPRRDQGVGDPSGFRRVRVASNGSPFGGGEQTTGGCVMGPRRPVCLADSPSMRRPQVSPLPQNSAPQAVDRLRGGP